MSIDLLALVFAAPAIGLIAMGALQLLLRRRRRARQFSASRARDSHLRAQVLP